MNSDFSMGDLNRDSERINQVELLIKENPDNLIDKLVTLESKMETSNGAVWMQKYYKMILNKNGGGNCLHQLSSIFFEKVKLQPELFGEAESKYVFDAAFKLIEKDPQSKNLFEHLRGLGSVLRTYDEAVFYSNFFYCLDLLDIEESFATIGAEIYEDIEQAIGDKWAIFSCGTVIHLEGLTGNLSEHALKIIKKYGPVYPGTPSGDMMPPVQLGDRDDWCLVSYPHCEKIFNVVNLPYSYYPANSMEGRGLRVQDSKSLKIEKISC